jgi:hypothetical protein
MPGDTIQFINGEYLLMKKNLRKKIENKNIDVEISF